MNEANLSCFSDIDVGNIFLKIYRNHYESTHNNRQFFLKFFAFALQRAKISYCNNGIDLVVPYLLNEKNCLNFVEIGFGIPLEGSLTALLEAKYGWNGILYEEYPPNIQQLRDCRQVLVCEAKYFISSECQNINKKNLDGQISFLAIRGCDIYKTLNAIDLNVERIPLIYIYSPLEILDDLTQFLLKFGYNPWLTEYFIDGDFAHVFFKLGDLEEAHSNCFDYSSQELVKSSLADNFDTTKSTKNSIVVKNSRSRLEFLSCHFPKAAGSSLLEGIKSFYTGKSLYLDYDHIPGVNSHNSNRPLCIGSDVRAVHGHFHIRSYSNLNPNFTITFIRDPVNLLISFYEFIKINPNFCQDMGIKMVPLTEFVFTNSFSPYKTYFRYLEPSDFDFIGTVETFETSLINLTTVR